MQVRYKYTNLKPCSYSFTLWLRLRVYRMSQFRIMSDIPVNVLFANRIKKYKASGLKYATEKKISHSRYD